MEKINLQRIKEQGADFFVTGNRYIRDCLNLKFIHCVHEEETANRGGVILCEDTQDLQRDYSIAKEVFEHVERGTIKFVLIGLSPYIESENNVTPSIAWDIKKDAPILENYIKLCIDNGAKPVVCVFPVKESIKETYKANVLKRFRDTIKIFVKKYKALFIDLLDVKLIDKFFRDNGHLNSDGSIAFSALLSARLYSTEIFSVEDILYMDDEYFIVLEKNFSDDYKTLTHHIFCKMASDDLNCLSKTMPKEICMDLMARVFSEMTYNHLTNLSYLLSKDDYNEIADRIFKISAEKINRKDKIKVGFLLLNPEGWCGDDLYNFFKNDKRFETKLFLAPVKYHKLVQKEFYEGIERFKSHGLNCVAINELATKIPEQDILLVIMPYNNGWPTDFRPQNQKATTLLLYVPYAIITVNRSSKYYDLPIFSVAWKIFLSSKFEINLYDKGCHTGMSRAIYSGHPKIDVFFNKDIIFKFKWKMTQPDAKKIIWAPHHSLESTIDWLSTFRWNYQFMYEFAKAHPEISWVVKPHPRLFFSSVKFKLFSSVTERDNYFKKWNELPNAQVYTGAYYQTIFATSDGMIHDCGSFIAEYQYVDKPMIYLYNTMNTFNDWGKEILNASYLVDGKDLEGIAAMIQRVFIEGDDYKASERKEVFDKYLNYPKANGMLASEFIYKNILQGIYEEK